MSMEYMVGGEVALPIYIANILKSIKANPSMLRQTWHSRVTQMHFRRFPRLQHPTMQYYAEFPG